MGQRIALWAGVLAFALVGAVAIWQGLPLLPIGEGRYYLLTAVLFLAAAAFSLIRGRKDPGEGAVWGWGAGFAALLVSIGAYLTAKGGQLIGLGGSPYYAVVGVALIAIAALHVRRSPWAARLYALLLAATLIWSVFEAGLEFWALLARIAAFLVVGLWFLAPWTGALYRSRSPEARGHAGWNLVATVLGVLLLGVAAFQSGPVQAGSDFGRPKAAAVTDWRAYGGTTLATRFAEADQINTGNVGRLKEVWRYRTRVPYDFKDTPIEANGLLYVCTAGNTVIALDPDSGQEIWRRATAAKVPGGSGPTGLEFASTFARTCRGLGYYDAGAPVRAASAAPPALPVAPGQVGPQPVAAARSIAGAPSDCPTRIITGTTNAKLMAFDARTGEPCASFGQDGVVDLLPGLGFSPPGNYMVTSAPLIAGDLVVVGGWVSDNQRIGNPSGVVRAYSARDGHFVWAWDLGNPDAHGMPPEGGQFTRSTPNAWTNLSYDPELNLVYAPTGNSSPDYFAGSIRTPEADKYSSSVVAIDAATGGAAWVFQTVHRDIWDYDAPSQPVLVNVRRNGQVIPAVAQPTKRGEIFLLDRRTGAPVAPIEEKPVPQGPEPGERITATQPVSSLPNFRKDRVERDMWGLTPLDQLYCRVEFKKMRYEGHFTPPMRGVTPFLRSPPGYEPSYVESRIVGGETSGGSFQYPGNAGGFNWGSVSVDADNGILVAAPMLMGNRITLSTPADRKAQMATIKLRQEAWWKAHPADKARYDAAIAKAKASGRGQGGPGGNPEGGPAGRASPAADQSKVLYQAATSPFMSFFHVPFLGETQIPCFEPPFGVIAAMDLNTGKLLWTRPFGSMRESGPFGWKSKLPFMVGTPIQSGSMTTRGGLIFHAGSMDSTIRAYDLRKGEVLWSAALPASAQAVPMSYVSPRGRQIVVVTVANPTWAYPRDPNGGGQPTDDQGGWVIAYALE